MIRQKGSLVGALLLTFFIALWPLPVLADFSASTHYEVNETFFGAGGSLSTTCSTSYCSQQSLGESALGNPSSTNYQAHAGFNTDQQPWLYFTVANSATNLGELSTATTATTTATFTVRTYQAGGYAVNTVSPPPASTEGHTMSTPSTPTASAVGTEQFGINLVANTSPVAFGANPVDNPSSGAAVGIAATNYNTVNNYMYRNGDVIASSKTPGDTTGEADYTISYIFNIGSSTPAGNYSFNQVLVATATY
jgi:hypothetical protein